MKYKESQLDVRLRSWFKEDYAHRHLRRIHLEVGNLRGLNKLDIEFDSNLPNPVSVTVTSKDL